MQLYFLSANSLQTHRCCSCNCFHFSGPKIIRRLSDSFVANEKFYFIITNRFSLSIWKTSTVILACFSRCSFPSCSYSEHDSQFTHNFQMHCTSLQCELSNGGLLLTQGFAWNMTQASPYNYFSKFIRTYQHNWTFQSFQGHCSANLMFAMLYYNSLDSYLTSTLKLFLPCSSE